MDNPDQLRTTTTDADALTFEAEVFQLTGTRDRASALAAVRAGDLAWRNASGIRAGALRVELRAILERGLMGGPGHPPRLSLGMIQKQLPTVLRGEQKREYLAAIERVLEQADTENATVSADQLVDAVCSVALTAEDVAAIRDFARSSPPVAAETYLEPHRDADREFAEVDAIARTVAKAANEARARLDGKPINVTPANSR